MHSRLLSIGLAAVALSAGMAPAVNAREIDRQEIGEEFADNNQPERRVYCRDTRLFTLSTGEEVRSCINWRAQVRFMVKRTYAVLDGPDTDTRANLRAVRDCFDIAVSAGQRDEQGAGKADFLDLTKAEFRACLTVQQVENPQEYSIRTIESVRWNSWR